MKAQTWVRWASFAVWAAVAASAAFWAMRLFVAGAPVPGHAVAVGAAQSLRGDPLRVLGRSELAAEVAVVPAAASRFRLLGVMAPRAPKAADEGVALIAVDGRPARAYRVGATVDGELVLQRVRARGAELGARGAAVPSLALEVPALPPPATGVMPGLAGGAGGSRPPVDGLGRPLMQIQPAGQSSLPRLQAAEPDTEPDAAEPLPAVPAPPAPPGTFRTLPNNRGAVAQ